MAQLKFAHYLTLALIATGTFIAIITTSNFLVGLLASSVTVLLTFLVWTQPIPRAFIQQHQHLLYLASLLLLVLVFASRWVLPASDPFRQNIITIEMIPLMAMLILASMPKYTQE